MKVTGDPATEPVGAPTSSTGSNEATEDAPTAEAADESANWNRRGAASSLSELARLGSFLVFNVAAFLLIIRYLPKEQMGWYALVNVVINLAFVVADLQMDKVAVRRVTQREDPEEVIGAAVGVRLAGSVLATLAAQLIFLAIGLARGGILLEVQLAALLASSQFFGESFFVVGAVFQSQLRAYLDVAPRMVYVGLRFAFTLMLLALEVPWWALFFAWVGAYAIADVVAYGLFRLKAGIRLRPRLRGTRLLVGEALTLGVAGLLGLATVQFGTIYLGVTAPPETVAIFNAAILPIQYLSLFGSVIAIVAFPLASAAWIRKDRIRFGRIDATARTAILALFLPVSILLFQAPLAELLNTGFGPGYDAAAQPLRLMSIALILASLMVWAGFVFLSIGRPRLILAINALCLTVGVAASPLVVPRFGLPGLAAVGIVATMIGAVSAALLLRKFAPYSFDARGTFRLAVLGTILWLALSATRTVSDNFLVLATVTAIAYPLLVITFRVFPKSLLDDLRATADGSLDLAAAAPGCAQLAGGVDEPH
ncbi:polysaccharide biosynthesis C-terminal domain-containing protein [Candidatus Neomicrothrix sp.]|uniref:polysaccharide biosynthesis C-terminal domain-containing protein n=1 Tax=Candidatus Neomicrothrix sp. TaxID=2719034 RepID=UPI0025934337|nr:polysaccharide biosynthesis C-terminal domain-containing protein [Candidatus Microthrix sp.]HMS47077.1 polysaccharide biosynthesis C-terminal domain-containing protein [Candidatus Microthrix sp.]